MKAAIYVRTGSTDQSIYYQIAVCRKFIGEKGGEVVEVYSDKGVNAHTLDRAGLNRLLNDAAMQKFDTLVVTEYERLYRSQKFIDSLLLQLHEYNIMVIMAKE
ncbi:MAG: recombinase family protein [Bacilli bacterium]|nr:recombinase family protein [Bacilli bacterium]